MGDTRSPPRSRPGCARRFTAREYPGARRIDPVGGLPVCQHLRRIGSREIDQLAAALAAMVQQQPMEVGSLDSVLKNPASYPASSKGPTSIPASTPAQRVAPKPARVPTPPVPSWMKKSGYRDQSDD